MMCSLKPCKISTLALLLIAAGLLSGCQTTGSGPPAEAAKPPDPPMTRSLAATQCWMSTEKSNANADIDKRADIVTKCIDQKMKAAAAAPKT